MAGIEAPSSFESASDLQSSFWEHLEDLRKTAFKILWTIALGIVLSLFFYSSILDWLLTPLTSQSALVVNETKHQQIVNHSLDALDYTVPHKNYSLIKSSPQTIQKGSHAFKLPSGGILEISFAEKSHPLALLSPLEGMQTTLKICFWIGLAATSPLWLWFIGQFIYPALHAGERKLLLPFLLLSLLFLGLGALFAYFVTIPLSNEMLFAFNNEIGVNLWSFSRYIDYTFLLLLANGLAFEIALLLFFCVHVGLLSADFMQSKRRHMILVAFIIGALLTPPDVFTQVMLAVPLIGLYELALLYARFRHPVSNKSSQEFNAKAQRH